MVKSCPSIAMLGCGAWGKNLIRNLYKLNILKYIYDPDKSKTKSIIKKYHIKYANIKEILNDKSIKSIIIATPIDTHYELSKIILKKKKNIFVEKPLTSDLRKAYELKYISKKNKTIIMVGHILNYHTGFIKIKKIMNSICLNNIHIFSNRMSNSYENENNKYIILWDYAPHDISIILNIIKNKILLKVYAYKKIIKNKIYTSIKLIFENNILSNINLSYTNSNKIQNLKIKSKDNKILILDDTLSWNKKLQLNKKYILFKKKEPLLNECIYFIYCINNRKTPISDSNESIKIIKIIQIIIRSIKEKKLLTFNK